MRMHALLVRKIYSWTEETEDENYSRPRCLFQVELLYNVD